MRYYQFKLTEEEVQNLKSTVGPKMTNAELEDDLDNICLLYTSDAADE